MTNAYRVAYATFLPGMPAHDEYAVLFGLAGHLVRSQYRLHIPGPHYFSLENADDHPLTPIVQLFLLSGMLPETASWQKRRHITDSVFVEVRMAHAFLINSSRGYGMTDEEIEAVITASPPP